MMHLTVAALVGLLLAAGPVFAAGDSQVADAAERQDTALVARLLARGADASAPQPDGATALHWAVYHDLGATVDLLLRRGAAPNAVNDHGVTPLALACEGGNGPLVERLLRAGADPNVRTVTGITPLMMAARAGAVEAVRALLAKGADVNAVEPSHGQTALMWSVSQAHPGVTATLVENGADVRARTVVRHRTIQTGNRYGDQNSIKGSVGETDLGGFTPLLFAARGGDLESARHLIKAGAPVDDAAANGATALTIAAHSGHGPLGIFLLEQGANPNADAAGYTPLHAAVLRGDLALMKALLSKGANPNARLTKGTSSRYYSKDYAFNDLLVGATPILLAARYGEPDMVRALAAAGADPKVTLPDGTTLIMAAISVTRGYGAFRAGDKRERYQGPADVAAKVDGEDERITRDIVQIALELGVDPNAATKTGDTALHLAAAQSLDTVIPVLAEHGAALEPKNARGLTPLALTALTARFGFYAMDAQSRAGTAAVLKQLGAKE
ncbi:MAG: ankyrin repeat domain-containing protein [Vicinamibacterales bacterium]